MHNHLGGGKATLTPERVRHYLDEMDAAGVRTVVNLDGGWGQRLKETLAALDEAHPGRFLTYALIDFSGIDEPGWSEREAARLAESFEAGAKGLKFHKTLGLGVRYKDGRFLPVDDPKLDPIWEVCARYKRPVEIHTGDPGAFFTPLDRYSERWHELNEHPEWLFHGKDFPGRSELHAQRIRVIARHPNTTFICAHMANDGEDLAEVGRWLDAYPNMYVDIDARISELGRQPYTARRFFLKYQDRIMFGTDTAPNRDGLPDLLPVPRDRRRVLRPGRRPPPAGLLDDLRRVPAQGRAGEALLQERGAAARGVEEARRVIDAEILRSMTMSKKSKVKKPLAEPVVPDESAHGIGSSGDSFDWRTFKPSMLEGGAKAPLATELVTYRDRLDELLQHQGEYVVIKGREIAGFFRNRRSAVEAAVEAYGPRPVPRQESCGEGAGPSDRSCERLMPIIPISLGLDRSAARRRRERLEDLHPWGGPPGTWKALIDTGADHDGDQPQRRGEPFNPMRLGVQPVRRPGWRLRNGTTLTTFASGSAAIPRRGGGSTSKPSRLQPATRRCGHLDRYGIAPEDRHGLARPAQIAVPKLLRRNPWRQTMNSRRP